MKNNETITAIKDFKTKEHFFRKIADKINKQLNEKMFLPMFNILNIKPVIARNDINILIEALMSNKIYYVEGGFKSRTGKFNNRISLELEKIGAKYSKYKKMYCIHQSKLPQELLVAVSTSKRIAQQKIKAIDELLKEYEGNTTKIVQDMVFNDEVEYILDDVTGQMKFNIKKNINIIEPELNETQRENIYRNYNNNMQFYIKNWLNERIPEMRTKVYQAVIDGYREDYVEKMLINEYNIKINKAKFLAQNETSIMLAELKKQMYTAMNFEWFIWVTILDSKERPEHRKLNGEMFRFDNPPTVITKDGRTTKGLPGAIDYNCRCSLIPIRKSSPFYSKTDIEKMRKRQNYKQNN